MKNQRFKNNLNCIGMNLVKTIEQYDDNCVYFCDPIKNNIMNDSNFIRIMYSNDNLVLNGIYLLMKINNFICEKYYDKYRCVFNVNSHQDLIQNLKNIEETILKKINIIHKIPQLKINEQLKNGNIKIFNDITDKQSCMFILKISGVWETQYNYGLTYKFVKTN